MRDLSDAELQTRATELSDELFHLRLRRVTSQLPNPMKVRETRRDLARAKTILAERARGAAPAPRHAAPEPPAKPRRKRKSA
jgi:large subunit ribosomal protein L29